VPVRAPIRRPRPQSSSAGSQSLWLIPPISGGSNIVISLGRQRSRETPIYQGIRCDSYNGVEVSGLEPPTSTLRTCLWRTSADCGELSRQFSELSTRWRTTANGGVRGISAG
jgi:hypothetical protein